MSGPGDPAAAVGRGLGSPFWQVWTASTGSNLGDGIRRVALPLLAVSVTTSPLSIGLVAAAGSVPWLLFGLAAGALVDRWDRLRTMCIVNAARAGVMAVLAGWVLLGHPPVWVLVAAAFLIGTGETFVDNAAQAVLPQVVDRDQLDVANGRLYAGQVVAGQFLGQGVGGALFAIMAGLPFGVDSATFAFASLIILPLSRTAQASKAPTPALQRLTLLGDIKQAVHWLIGQRLLRGLLATVTALGLASGAFWAVIALYSQQVLHLSAAGYGVMLAVGAAGSLLGSLTANSIRNRLGTARAVYFAVILVVGAAFALAVTTSAVLAAGMLIVNGFGVLLWNVVSTSLRQKMTPPDMLGRISATFRLAALGAMAIGSLAAGALAQATSLPAVFRASAAILTVTAVLAAPAIAAGRGTASNESSASRRLK